MRNIDDYLEAAREKNRLLSDTQLSKMLGLSSSAVSNFRKKKALPSPETMVKLSRLAGLDEQVALIELSFMSAPAEGEAKAVYEKLIKRLGVTSAALALLIFSNIPQANAAVSPIHFAKNLYAYVNDTVYYGKYRKIIHRIKAFFHDLSVAFIQPFQDCHMLT